MTSHCCSSIDLHSAIHPSQSTPSFLPSTVHTVLSIPPRTRSSRDPPCPRVNPTNSWLISGPGRGVQGTKRDVVNFTPTCVDVAPWPHVSGSRIPSAWRNRRPGTSSSQKGWRRCERRNRRKERDAKGAANGRSTRRARQRHGRRCMQPKEKEGKRRDGETSSR